MSEKVVINDNNVIIRQMNENDVLGAEDVLDSWYYPRHIYLSTLFTIDRKGFFVAIDCTNDQVIGVCMGPFIRPDVAFVSNYCVRPEYRGRGIGQKLFKCVMDYIEDRNCCLITGEHKYGLYKGLGFVLDSQQKVIIYRGHYNAKETDISVDNNIEIKPIVSEELMESIIDYDQHIHSYRRGQLLRLSLKEVNCQSLAAMETIDGKRVVVGYGCLRAFNENTFTLLPVYADNHMIAKQIIVSLMAMNENVVKNEFTFPVISANIWAIRIAEELGLKRSHELSLLYRNSITEYDYNRIYSLFTANSTWTV